MRRPAYQHRRWPDTPLFQAVASRWCKSQSNLILSLVWRGCDSLIKNDLEKIPLEKGDEAKEESLNHMLSVHIQRCSTGDEPFAVVHQPPEQHRRASSRAQSPHPDIGFTWYENHNCVWPIEGKILRNVSDVSAYVAEILDNFVPGRYATFSLEGAMLGYLFADDPFKALANIAKELKQKLRVHPKFPKRPHQISMHTRDGVAGRGKESFICHHLALLVGHTDETTEGD